MNLYNSVVMIGLAAEYRHGAVNLLGEEEAHHLVGKSHPREGELTVGPRPHCIGEPIRASYHEHQTATPADGLTL